MNNDICFTNKEQLEMCLKLLNWRLEINKISVHNVNTNVNFDFLHEIEKEIARFYPFEINNDISDKNHTTYEDMRMKCESELNLK